MIKTQQLSCSPQRKSITKECIFQIEGRKKKKEKKKEGFNPFFCVVQALMDENTGIAQEWDPSNKGSIPLSLLCYVCMLGIFMSMS